MTQPPGRIRVILNPTASGGAGASYQGPLEESSSGRGLSLELALTEGPNHAKELAQDAVRDGVEKLLVVGGDGTIHEVANGILLEDGGVPALGVLPVGTGNDFYRMIGPRPGLDGALDLLQGGVVRHFDVGRVRLGERSSFFVNLLGVGIDVEILKRRKRFMRLRGLSQYLVGLSSVLLYFRPVSFRVSFKTGEAPGTVQVLEDRTILAALTVGPSIGGGFKVNPDASPYDGRLDLFFVKALGMLKVARYIPKLLRGARLDVPEVVQRTITGARIERQDGEPFFFEMDGENMPEPASALEIEVCPGMLPVLVPEQP
jgi:diacylglycerol kinase (ATP)